MQTVQIFIYVDGVANRIELFKDEKISVTSSIQNFNDIGKLFTDYSQSFTIPASKHNNAIFRHWYESAVGENNDENPLNVDGAFDHRIKYYGFIEIDTIPFRDGKFILQKSNKKNGFIESYTINFVGNLVQLKDKFKDDKLISLNGYDTLNFEYNVGNVTNRIYTLYDDITFPLIGSNRRYEFGTSTSSDITTTSGAIDYRELFPAIQVKKIFEFIEDTYGLNFSGTFLNYTEFTKLYLYCKNAETFNFYGDALSPNFSSKTTGFTEFDLALEQCTISFELDPLADRLESWIKIEPTSSTITYSVDIYDNGVLYTSYNNLQGDSDLGYFSKIRINETIIGGQYVTHKFTYKVTSNLPMTFDAFVNLKRNYGIGANYFYRTAYSYGNTTSSDLQIKRYIPDITVEAFLSGIVKALNLVVIPIDQNTFEFQQIEAWYQIGDVVDVTKYIQANDIEITTANLFKKIDFKYEKSENILNNKYSSQNSPLEYGDLMFDNPNSAFTSNYEVKLPFENIMFERYTDSTFLTATCWNKDLQAYTPKPLLLYSNGIEQFKLDGTAIDAYYTDGTTTTDFSQYHRFSNEIAIGGTDLSYINTLNWNAEISTWYLQTVTNGLFQRYYSNQIFNLYNQRTRVLKVKGNFTPKLLTSIRLNDRLIVSNKRYIINTMTTDLTTGEVELELLNDFRQIGGVNIFRRTNIPELEVDNTAQVVEYLIYKGDLDYFDVKLAAGFLSYPLTTDNDTDITLEVTIPANTSAVDRTDNIILEGFKNGTSEFIYIPIYQYA
jgi:hypothetical protein